MDTLLLDQTTWDLLLDSAGNIAKASAPYALAQDVASAIRLFLGELWYDTTKGVPYFQEILGKIPATPLFNAYVEQAALTVPGVVTARCTVTAFSGRAVQGVVEFTDTSGSTNTVSL